MDADRLSAERLLAIVDRRGEHFRRKYAALLQCEYCPGARWIIDECWVCELCGARDAIREDVNLAALCPDLRALFVVAIFPDRQVPSPLR